LGLFQTWATEKDAQAQVGGQDAPSEVAENARAPRAQKQSVQNAQAPSFLQYFGWRN